MDKDVFEQRQKVMIDRITTHIDQILKTAYSFFNYESISVDGQFLKTPEGSQSKVVQWSLRVQEVETDGRNQKQ